MKMLALDQMLVLFLFGCFCLASGTTVNFRTSGVWQRARTFIPQAHDEAMRETMTDWVTTFAASEPLPDKMSPEFGMRIFFGSSPTPHRISMSALFLIDFRQNIKQKFGLSDTELTELLNDLGVTFLEQNKILGVPDSIPLPVPKMDICPYPRNYRCTGKEKYRTFDGSCNSLSNPIIGRMMTPYRRLLPPQYQDGFSTPRVAVSGQALPSARLISSQYLKDVSNPSPHIALIFTGFGQFIAHDIVRTADTLVTDPNSEDNVREVSCGRDGCDTTGGNDPCFPISIPSSEKNFTDRRCLNFVRSTPVPPLDCSSGHLDQINQVTHWLDLSGVYGSTVNDARTLREFKNGRMKVAQHPAGSKFKPMLPKSTGECRARDFSSHCFLAGDSRVNQNPGLDMQHVVWVRQHNSVADSLVRVNPRWSDEKVFEEARRIVIAIYQNIVYSEYLQLLVGPTFTHKFGLNPVRAGYNTGYKNDLDSRLSVELITAANRFGHSMIDTFSHTIHKGVLNDRTFIQSTFVNPEQFFNIRAGGLDGIVEGTTRQKAQSADRYSTSQLTVSLFTSQPPHGLGTDLKSLNIQRGRDHGIPSYTGLRQLLGLNSAKSFDDLKTLIPNDRINDLKKLYKNVDDIDLFVGGLSEEPVKGGAVGPTFAHIISESYQRLKFGDRFYYESPTAGFTPAQLQAIRRMSMRDILCRNGDNIPHLQLNVFRIPDGSVNKLLPCSRVNNIDFRLWRETSSWGRRG